MLFMKRDTDATPRNCYECHFLCARTPFSASLRDAIALKSDQRQKLVDGTYFDHADPKYTHVGCALGFWLYKSGKAHLDKLKKAVRRPRGDGCRWFPHSPGVDFVVATDLEERMTYRREAKRDRKWPKRGVWVAAIALMLNLGWSIWEHYNPPKIAPQKDAMSATHPVEPSAR